MTIEEQVRAAHPFFKVREDGVDTVISPATNNARYEAMIADRVAFATAAEAARVQEQQDAALRQGIINALADLDQIRTVAQGESNLTQAQIKSGFNTLARIQEDLIRVLIRRGVLS
jgi:hypothetical protein